MRANPYDDADAAYQRAVQEDPWVMYLIARRERGTSVWMEQLLSAAAQATVTLLSDPRAADEWADPIEQWSKVSFRKVALRARGARWENAQEVPGITGTFGDVQVRALVPMPRSDRPRVVQQCQAMNDTVEWRTEVFRQDTKKLFLSPHADMSSGKAMAQVGHAAEMLRQALPAAERDRWTNAGFPVQAVRSDQAHWQALLGRDDVVAVRDAGLTEVDPGTVTVAAVVS